MLPDHVVQLAGVQLESVEEVAQAERAGALIRTRKSEAMCWAPLRNPEEELARKSLAVSAPFLEVGDEFKADPDAGEGTLDLVREEESPNPVDNLPHGHEVPV